MTRTVDDLPLSGGTADLPLEFVLVTCATTALSWTHMQWDGWNPQTIPTLMITFEGVNANGDKATPATVVINVNELPTVIKQLVSGLAQAYDHNGPPGVE